MARNTILLRGDAVEDSFLVEASVAIRPGMLVEISPSAATHVQPHQTAGGAAAAIFARECHEDQGGDIDDTIAVSAEVTVLYPNLGSWINAYTSDTIAAGEWVESAGNGQIRLYGSGYRIGFARNASDLTGTYGRVEIVIQPIGV